MTLNVLDLVRNRGLAPKKVSTSKGGEWASPCPLCGGNDRFRVWPEQGKGEGRFWCRGCGKEGDLIEFFRWADNMSFKQACDAAGRSPDSRMFPTGPRRRTPERVKLPKETALSADHPEIWQEKAGAFLDWTREQLEQNQAAQEYLAKKRGITMETARRHKLGYNPGENGGDMYRPREKWGLKKAVNEKTGKPRRLWIPRGLVIPCFQGGRLIRLRVRRENVAENKYIALPGSDFGAYMVLGQGRAVWVVVEAELDAILLWQEAGDQAGIMASLQAKLAPDQAADRVLRRAGHILVALDWGDKLDRMGQRAGTQGWLKWEHDYPDQAVRWPVPKGKDPGEAWEQDVDLAAWVKVGIAKRQKAPVRTLGPSASGQDLEGSGVFRLALPKVEAPEFGTPEYSGWASYEGLRELERENGVEWWRQGEEVVFRLPSGPPSGLLEWCEMCLRDALSWVRKYARRYQEAA